MSDVSLKEYTDRMVEALDRRIDQRFIDLEKAMLLQIKRSNEETVAKAKVTNTIISILLGLGTIGMALWALLTRAR